MSGDRIHPNVTEEVVLAACEADEYLGFCIACGSEHEGCEPDMERETCQHCGEAQVYGAEQVLIMMGG